jgi:hypothetical protein
MKKLDKQTIAQIITLAAIDYIMSGEIGACYDDISDSYGLTTKQIDEILDKYNNVLEELVDYYQDILVDWVVKKL